MEIPITCRLSARRNEEIVQEGIGVGIVVRQVTGEKIVLERWRAMFVDKRTIWQLNVQTGYVITAGRRVTTGISAVFPKWIHRRGYAPSVTALVMIHIPVGSAINAGHGDMRKGIVPAWVGIVLHDLEIAEASVLEGKELELLRVDQGVAEPLVHKGVTHDLEPSEMGCTADQGPGLVHQERRTEMHHVDVYRRGGA